MIKISYNTNNHIKTAIQNKFISNSTIFGIILFFVFFINCKIDIWFL